MVMILPLLLSLLADTGAAGSYPGNAIGPVILAHSKEGPSVYGGVAVEHTLSRWFSLDEMVGFGEEFDWISAG
ncbi:MAG: hypothetical protein BWX47_01488 [candidate division Hyd24-12 bacterium ADurb.Bin004]|nr:MAG: hypothetical protein BWX47_01488 [candidate division Hyd24-12 bacterium ADurb.Bin004]